MFKILQPLLLLVISCISVSAESAFIRAKDYSNGSASIYAESNPTSSSRSIMYLNAGTSVQILERDGDWVRISESRGDTVGWTHSRNISQVEAPFGIWFILENLDGGADVWRFQKTTRKRPLGTIPAGSSVKVLAIADDIWALVKTDDNLYGWVYKRFLEPSKGSDRIEANQQRIVTSQINEFVPKGTCQVIVSTHSSKARAVSAVNRFNAVPWKKPSIFETQNGQFKFSIGNLRSAEVPTVLKELILGGDAPNAECVSGRDFVAKYDKQGSLVSGASSEPKQCYFVVASRQTNAEVAKFIDETPSIDASKFEIFRANNGWYAITLGLVDESSFESSKQSLDVPSDSFCTAGSEFTRAPHVCMRQPITCEEGYTVQYKSCEAQNAIGSLGIESGSAFCKMPQSFARETLVVDGFIGLEEDGQIYSFTAETNSEEFVVKIFHEERKVQFFWQKYVPKTNRVSPNNPNNRPGFFGTWFNNMFSYSGGPSSTSGTTIYHPTRKYILICREQGLLSDHVPTISISCTGEEQSCKQQFEQQVSSKYGGFSSACKKLVRANWYYSTIRIE